MNESKIYVGNLTYGTTEQDLLDFFSEFGAIKEAKLIIDRETSRSKGFAFITFGSDQSVDKAIATANGADLDGRTLKVNRAQNKTDGGSRGGFQDRW